MSIVLNRAGCESLSFDEQSKAYLTDQLKKDCIFQERLRRITLVAVLILFAVGCATSGLALAVVIPYGLFHTCATIAGAGTLALAGMGTATLASKELGSRSIAFLTNSPVYRELEADIRSNFPIDCEKSWTYLTKKHQEYSKIKEQSKKMLDASLTYDNPTTTLPYVVNLIEEY